MRLEIYSEANNIWKKAAGTSAPGQLSFEVEIYKKLLNFFHVGDYYYAIFNYINKDFEMVSKEVEMLLGYSVAEYNVPFLVNKIHPDDVGHFLNFENSAMDFLNSLTVTELVKYKIRHDYRIQKSNGEYIRMLQQGIVIQHDENGGILRTLIIHTDIDHLKPEGKPILSFIGLDNEPSYINVTAEQVYTTGKDVLTKREKQILYMLIDGKASKEIGRLLKISKQTVDKHRKNMLDKNKLNNTGELIGKAIKEGWL